MDERIRIQYLRGLISMYEDVFSALTDFRDRLKDLEGWFTPHSVLFLASDIEEPLKVYRALMDLKNRIEELRIVVSARQGRALRELQKLERRDDSGSADP